MIEKTEIDFATFEHFKPKNTLDLVNHFDENIKGAKNASIYGPSADDKGF